MENNTDDLLESGELDASQREASIVGILRNHAARDEIKSISTHRVNTENPGINLTQQELQYHLGNLPSALLTDFRAGKGSLIAKDDLKSLTAAERAAFWRSGGSVYEPPSTERPGDDVIVFEGRRTTQGEWDSWTPKQKMAFATGKTT